jgi:predicted KAP-like P-loop ATPase
MWSDNETERDFLNFTGVADTVAEIIVQAGGQPISIGVSGAWGVGKSSMIKLIRRALNDSANGNRSELVFVEFNAWLYQGYDDARASLLEVIATTLAREANERKSGVDKAQELLKRVDWLRAAKLTASSGLAIALGLPPVGLFGDAVSVGKVLIGGGTTAENVEKTGETAAELGKTVTGLLKPRAEATPPKEIHAIRKSFEETLAAMKVKLVVLIDDLDRCLPETTISTLEAIRLLLFLDNTAFVIAADDVMIKHAVRRHFEGIEDENVVTSYFDKLIQIPIRVPPLGTQEVRAYIMLLYVENSALTKEEKEAIREKVCAQLKETWRGRRVDRAFMQTTHANLSGDLIARFDTADRLAPLMTSASRIAGNPRLIKRFLNALSIRMSIARAHGVGVDEAVLTKLMLFERCGNPQAYSALVKSVVESDEGKPSFLKEWEDAALKGQALKLSAPWEDSFVADWLTVPPRLADIDLRGALYVSREHAPLISPEDRLSSEGAELLAAILEHPDMAGGLHDRLVKLPRPEFAVVMDRVLERARQEQEWGTPPILTAALAIAEADPTQGERVAGFLRDRPAGQITAAIVPKISGQPWTESVYAAWDKSKVSPQVKKAITQQKAEV